MGGESRSIWCQVLWIGMVRPIRRRVAIGWVARRRIARRDGGIVPVGSSRGAACHAGDQQWRPWQTDDVDEDGRRPVRTGKVTFQDADIEGELSPSRRGFF